MHTYLVLDTDPNRRRNEIIKQTAALGISPFDCITPSYENASVGISDIRTFIKRLSLAPVRGAFSAGVIAEAEKLTLEAQQALLKTLEEPPNHAYIFLGASNNMQLIPTIMSRCTILSHNAAPSPDSTNDTAIETFINDLLSASPGKKIHLVASIGKSKEEIELFINTMLHILRTAIVSDTLSSTIRHQKIRLVHRLLNAKNHLPHNVQPHLLLEQALL